MATEDTYGGDIDAPAKTDEDIVREAMRRFDICATWENDARLRFIEDVKFCNGDADNLFQWDSTSRTARGYGTIDERPCLTINKTRQHCLNIINDAKQNKPGVKIKPVGNGATYDAAQVFEGICRHIEYISNAQAAYDTATTFQVQGGIGWIRLTTDYPDYNDHSFDQEIFIRRVKDPLTVYLDPDIREADGSDARYGFVFDDMTRDAFVDKYPNYKDMATKSPLDVSGVWVRQDQVRVAEYYRVTEAKANLVSYIDPLTGVRKSDRQDQMHKELYKQAIDDPGTKERDIIDRKIEWFLIAGDKIIERSIWAGRYIPLVRVIGEETIINGQLDRKGHTRAMKDPQRLANYWYSAATEHVALQSKTPYIGPMAAFENLETYWDSANTVNHAWLPYNQYDDKGQKLEQPARQAPPVMAQAYIEGLKIASQEIKEVSGQFEADLGMPSNEKSGVAIQQRQRQGDNATYHYIDNLALAIRFIGKQLIDLIPKIYDTPRVIKIMAEDGIEHEVSVDPQAQQAYQQKQQQDATNVQSIFNPSVGRYDVEADVGPAYATRRQEAFNAMMQLMKQDPDLMKIAGDLFIKAADFPMSDKIAERIKNTISPQILSGAPPGPSQAEQQGQKQLQAQGQLLQKMSEALSEAKSQVRVHQEQKGIDAYKAVTERMKVLLPMETSPADRDRMAHELMAAEHSTNMGLLADSHSSMLSLMEAHNQPQEPQPQDQQQPDPQAMQAPMVQARAKGGPVQAGRPYLVGEKGPELIIPQGNGTVVPNMAGKYNTPLNEPDAAGYAAWLAQLPKGMDRTGNDYDLQGAYLSGLNASGGHLPDTFKKPNHPTFSNESTYSGKDGFVGGAWKPGPDGKWTYAASPTNLKMHSAQGLHQYFQSTEPDVSLVIPGGQ